MDPGIAVDGCDAQRPISSATSADWHRPALQRRQHLHGAKAGREVVADEPRRAAPVFGIDHLNHGVRVDLVGRDVAVYRAPLVTAYDHAARSRPVSPRALLGNILAGAHSS